MSSHSSLFPNPPTPSELVMEIARAGGLLWIEEEIRRSRHPAPWGAQGSGQTAPRNGPGSGSCCHWKDCLPLVPQVTGYWQQRTRGKVQLKKIPRTEETHGRVQ